MWFYRDPNSDRPQGYPRFTLKRGADNEGPGSYVAGIIVVYCIHIHEDVV
jgi:hypothetical protein